MFGALTIVTNVHPKLQSHKYRSMRTLAFVATGMSVVAPLIHGLDIFGLDIMNKKAFTYTMVAKTGCLLSGTALYAVRLPFCPAKIDPNTPDATDEVSRKLVAWKIRHVQLPLIHAHSGGLRRCYPDDRVSRSLRLCLLKYHLLGLLS
jgi:predicted membrane channel-forming protein YqfA (hemolysin III family)